MVWTTPKTFTAGERLFAQDLNTYVSDNLADLDPRTVKSFADASARTAAIPSPDAGAVTFLEDTDAVEVYDGSAWTAVGAGVVNLQWASGTASVSSVGGTDATMLSLSYTPLNASNLLVVQFSGNVNADRTSGSSTLRTGFVKLAKDGTDVSVRRFGQTNEDTSLSRIQFATPFAVLMETAGSTTARTYAAILDSNGATTASTVSDYPYYLWVTEYSDVVVV